MAAPNLHVQPDDSDPSRKPAPQQLPELMRMDASRWARKMRRLFPQLRSSNGLALALARYIQSQVRDKTRRGRPPLAETDKAECLWKQYRKEYPAETKRQILDRICPQAIEGWAAMTKAEQVQRRRQLRGQMRSRRNQRKRRRRLQAGNKSLAIVSPETSAV
jgi:hypothetical protein